VLLIHLYECLFFTCKAKFFTLKALVCFPHTDAKQEENDVTAAQKKEIRATSDGATVEPSSTPPPTQLSSSPLEPSKSLLLADDHVNNRADLDHTSANDSDSSIRFDFVLSPDSSVSVNSSYAYLAPANEADASTYLPSLPPTGVCMCVCVYSKFKHLC